VTRGASADVPPDHRARGRTLGAWVAHIRTWRSRLPPDWIERLAVIEHWHW